MSNLAIDQWTNIATLLYMGIGSLWLTVVLVRRTRRWNGVGVAMTLFTLGISALYLMGSWNWVVRTVEHVPGIPIWMRVLVRFAACVILTRAIYKVQTVDLVAVKHLKPDDVPADGMP